MARTATINVSIQAAPTTVLAQVAAAMPNRSWVYFDGTTQNGVACPVPSGISTALGASANGSMPWSNKVCWNPKAVDLGGGNYQRAIELLGTDHSTGLERYSRYLESSHSVDLQTWVDGTYSISHSFDKSTVNPYTGHVWHRNYGNTSAMYRYPSGATPILFIQGPPPEWSNIFGPIDWWFGSITDGGTQGLLLYMAAFDSSGAQIDAYDPVSATWVWRTGFNTKVVPQWSVGYSGSSYNRILVYSPTKNVAIFGGRNAHARHLWRLDSSGTITRLNDTPIDVGVGACQVIAEPITGNYIVNSDQGFYEFNPDGAGTWTLLADNRPASLNKTNSGGGGGTPSCVGCCVYTHNVIAWFSTGSGYGRMHLYKHGP